MSPRPGGTFGNDVEEVFARHAAGTTARDEDAARLENGQGGGIQPGYEAELRFDGKTYPANPSVPPARPLKGKPEGEMLIAPPTR